MTFCFLMKLIVILLCLVIMSSANGKSVEDQWKDFKVKTSRHSENIFSKFIFSRRIFSAENSARKKIKFDLRFSRKASKLWIN